MNKSQLFCEMKRNKFILFLMVSSLVLLMAFQVLWILNSYENAFYNFRRDTNILFKNTVMNMRLTTFMDNMVEVVSDSTHEVSDSIARKLQVYQFDSLKGKEKMPGKKGQRKNMRVFIESGEFRQSKTEPRVKFFKDTMMRREESTFIVRLHADTLSLDSIRKNYLAALSQAKIKAHFEVTQTKAGEGPHMPPMDPVTDLVMDNGKEFSFTMSSGKEKQKLNIYADTVHSDPVRYSPFQLYGAKLFGIQGIILKQITPQILFSLILTFVITAAFFAMYKNIREQQKLMEIKNDFISNVTHELKTPVATVSVALEALKNFNALDNPKRTAEYLDIAQSELNRLTLMTDKILKTSVFEKNGVQLSFTTVALDALVEQVIASMRLVLEKRNIQLSYQKAGDRFVLEGAEEHLTNVLYNLIDNAIKYSGDGSEITIDLKEQDFVIVMSVKDQGIGIAKEFQEKIFEKFFRVPSGDLHNIKGYGLGLSYVAGVVASHHGKITVDSELNIGSTFTITLPKSHVS
jgi:two-component system, OmpR family, phosphate regulon sensor histidine kinase PhoR